MRRDAFFPKPTRARASAPKVPCEIVLVHPGLVEELRTTVARECTAAMARLERARIGWHQFERQDKPAFVRWRAREFGALLSTAREVEDRIRGAHTLIYEVEMEMRRRFQDPYSAYQRVMFRRSGAGQHDAGSGSEDADNHSGDGASRMGETTGRTRKPTEFEQEALFQEWVQKFLGTHPDKMDDEVYSTTFEVFKSHMFLRPTAENQKLATKPRKRAAVDEESIKDAAPESVAIDPRVKELYRRLVRRLHPDLRADGNASVSGLWHEVQEAYAASDVARMELLLALSDLSEHFGAGTTLSQMRLVLAELNRSVRALEKSLLEAEDDDAWNFVRIGPSDDLRVRVERELKHDLAKRQERLDLLDRTIADWACGRLAIARFGRCGSVSSRVKGDCS